MKADLEAEGVHVDLDSARRSVAEQQQIVDDFTKKYGEDYVKQYVAVPGYSEHHTGLAMDITASGRDTARLPANAPVMDWLNENAWQYGFIQRYPENKTDETGYIYEQWHYRYVGKELAEVLYNNGDWITMEAYFGFDSVYRD